ncbi:UNVERIFIED_CONTAM: hypothetical protein FKN15_011186 [Acipenser sinensis]
MMLPRSILLVTLLCSLAGPLLAEVGFLTHDFSTSLENILPTMTRPVNSSRSFYGIMFDAGSTGTRIHIYKFIQKVPGILAWVTVNFLTGHLYLKSYRTVGTLDLGGGSTQITFLPKTKRFKDDWTFGGITYKVSGNPEGYTGYKHCYQEVVKVVKGTVHQPMEVKASSSFYAFSYYFDRAVESGLIDGQKGGIVEVRDFKKKAKEVCNKMTKYRPISPYLCMDMTYITALLKDGFGFKESTVLKERSSTCMTLCDDDDDDDDDALAAESCSSCNAIDVLVLLSDFIMPFLVKLVMVKPGKIQR